MKVSLNNKIYFATNAHSQFWGGFLRGMQQAAQQQYYYQQQLYYQQQQQQRRQASKPEPIEETVENGKNGFTWIKLRQWNKNSGKIYYGAKDANGKTIIPLSRCYTGIYFMDEDGCIGYFKVEKGDKEGGMHYLRDTNNFSNIRKYHLSQQRWF